MNTMHIKKNDTVVVISGEDKGKKGKVLKVDNDKKRVIIEGINMATKHKKPRRQGEIGGIIHQEASVSAASVMHVCDKCHQATRIGYTVLGDGTKVRVCKKCGETFEK